MSHLIQSIYQYLLHNQNQFASGGLLLMVVGAIGAVLRKIPQKIWEWIVGQVTLNITINDDNKAFFWLKQWFDSQRRMKTIRRVDVYTPTDDEYIFNPAPGGHWMWYKNRPIHVTLTRNEEKKDKYAKRSESFGIRTLGRNQTFLREFVDEIFQTYVKKQTGKPRLYFWAKQWGEYRWVEQTPYVPRPLETVILDADLKDKILQDIQTFQKSKRWYAEMGIPYHRGYLFYGPPGTGKTSLVVGLSSHFCSKVYLLKLSDMTDSSLLDAVSRVEPNGMIVMEDVDCMSSTRARREEDEEGDGVKSIFGVTLSGLLNVLDGLSAPCGVLFFMTTNQVEKLDSALIRPGRIDVKLSIGEATDSQKRELFNRFFPDQIAPDEILDKSSTMAELQEHLLRQRNNQIRSEETAEVA